MLVWMDLEMTGLDPARDVIVEIATIVTDDELEIVAEGPDLVVHQPDEALAAMDPVVVEMHTSSGLLEAIKASTITLEEAGAATLEFIKDARARAAHRSRCAATRSAPTGASSPSTCRRSRSTSTTGRSTSPRSRSSPGAGTRARSRPRRARPPPTAPSTTSASRSRSCAGTAPTSSSRLDRLTRPVK